MDKISIGLFKFDRRAKWPLKSYRYDAGYDLYVIEDIWVLPFSMVDVPTGYNICVPEDGTTYIEITSRSSTFYRRKLLVNQGIVDAGYTGPLSVLVFNPTFIPKRIRRGERLAQIIGHRIPTMDLNLIYELPKTERNQRGFGSSGE